MPDEVADTLEAKRVGFTERAGDEHMRIALGQAQGILAGKIHVRLVENQNSLLSLAELGQVAGEVAASARCVRGRDVGECRVEIPIACLESIVVRK